jgi:hypothetical protein
MPEEKVEVVDKDGNVIETISRRPEEVDVTTVTRDDFPSELTDKRRETLLIATRHPEEDTRRRLAEMIEQRLDNGEYEMEAPSERTVGKALDEFYQPYKNNDDGGRDADSLMELTPKQQAILIARLADSNTSNADIAEMVGCAKSYPGQVFDRYENLLNQLNSRVATGEAPQAIVEEELNSEAIATLDDRNLISALPVNIEAIGAVEADEIPETPSQADSPDTVATDDEGTPAEHEYDPDHWGSPVTNSTGLRASPESPIESGSDDSTDASSSKNRSDEDSAEFEPVTIEYGLETGTEASEENEVDLSQKIGDLKENVTFFRQTIQRSELDEAELVVGAARQVEQYCNKLLQMQKHGPS